MFSLLSPDSEICMPVTGIPNGGWEISLLETHFRELQEGFSEDEFDTHRIHVWYIYLYILR